ncbi:MAG: alcohol dehydrogenase catalytic domain-containing protein, partial [Chloroflexota bacterium]
MPFQAAAAIDIEYGRPMIVDTVELPDPGPTQVIVKQVASGVCHSQLHRLHNAKQTRPGLLGHESTGYVAAAGRDVTYVKEGDPVMLSLLPRNAYPGMPR